MAQEMSEKKSEIGTLFYSNSKRGRVDPQNTGFCKDCGEVVKNCACNGILLTFSQIQGWVSQRAAKGKSKGAKKGEDKELPDVETG